MTSDRLLLDFALSLRRRPPVPYPNGTAQRILTESIQLFATRGYVGTSMRDIASAVGIRPASIYSHFESKEQILTEALAEMLYQFHSFMLEAIEVDRPPREQLRRLVEQHIRWQLRFREVAGSWDLLWEVEGLRQNLQTEARLVINERRERYHLLVEKLVQVSCPSNPNPRLRAEAILTLCDRAPNWTTSVNGVENDDESIVAAAWTTVEALLR